MAKPTKGKMKAFEKKDAAIDKKAGIKEGSAKDQAMDAKQWKKGGMPGKMPAFRKGGAVRGR